MITRCKNALQGAMAGWKQMPPLAGRAWRPSWLPLRTHLERESDAHPHSPEERGELFLAYNTASTEMETLNWLHATVVLTKSECVLETGAADGLGTLALAAACRDNGFGKVHSVEIEPVLCERITARLRAEGLANYAEVHCSDSLAFLRSTSLVFDFGFFDSLYELRTQEYEICRDRGLLTGIAAFHDTSPHRTKTLHEGRDPGLHASYREKLHAFAREPRCAGCFEHRLARGLFVLFPNSGES